MARMWVRPTMAVLVALWAVGFAAADQDEQQIEVEGADGARVQVQVEGGGQAQVRIQIGQHVFRPGQQQAQPADIKPTLTLKQEKPGGPALFTFALPEDATGALGDGPEPKAFFGETTVDPKSVTKTGFRFTWDVAGMRKEAPALRGTDVEVKWDLVPAAGGDGAASTTYTTTAHVTIGRDGAVTLGDVETTAPAARRPNVIFAANFGVRQSTRATRDARLTLIKRGNVPTTELRLQLTHGHQFTKQPAIKITQGTLAKRPKWNPKAVRSVDTTAWTPPAKLPKKLVTGKLTWTWASKAPATGEEETVTLTADIQVTPTGDLRMTSMKTDVKVTKAGKQPTIEPDAG